MNQRSAICLILLLIIANAGGSLHLTPVAAQDTVNCYERVEAAKDLLQQREIALIQGRAITAVYLIHEAENILAPCAVDAPSGILAAGDANQWTQVEGAIGDFDIDMMRVPGGCFVMGSLTGQGDEQPVHEVCLYLSYWIDKTEVTHAMYAACVDAGVCTPSATSASLARDTQPVTNVTWFQAQTYCGWRGLELPSEAAWEYAARGPEGWAYPWGNRFDGDRVVYGSNSNGMLADVGSRPAGASWVGALDMSGNAAEWVRTAYQSYPLAQESDDDTHRARVFRGGSYYQSLAQYLTTTRRNTNPPAFIEEYLGFRCASPTLSTPAPQANCRDNYQAALVLLEQERAALEMDNIGFAMLMMSNTRPLLESCVANDRWEPVSEMIDRVSMVQVPPSCFMMGRAQGASTERPVHEVCFDAPYWLDKTEVTHHSYAECVTAGACTPLPTFNNYTPRETQPVTYVTWFQAHDYCAWRDARLPTEAEWEYAARGPDGLLYPWGDVYIARHVIAGEIETENVGSRPSGASWVGALDMSGNAAEWVSSIYQSYPYSASDGREDPDDSTSPRVKRGGSFDDRGTYDLDVVGRSFDAPDNSNITTGFRCAK